jgi:alpha-beta hydrolase superfamily lysophospholipase
MKSFDFDWQSASKQTLRGTCWLPEENPQAIVCLIHGFGEHVKRYEHMGNNFTSQGLGLIGFDLIGHGASDGKRGIVKNYELFMTHIAEFLSLVKEKFSGLPVYLYGHSMGGNLVASFVLNYKPELQGTIITSPWVKLAKQPPKIQVVIGEFIGSLFPGFTSPAKLDVKDLSTDLSVGEAYSKDPLVHNRVSAALFVGITDAGEKILKNAEHFKAPILWMHGDADNITAHWASEDIAKRNEQIDFKIWEGMRHELHNEAEKDKVFEHVTSWMKKALKTTDA